MIVKKVEALDKPVSQYMVPVLTTDYMLHGLVHIPQTEFTQTPQVVNVNGQDLQCVAYSFNERIVFCLMFNPCLSHGHREWLGLPNFLPLSKFQMTSYWVAPVGNIAQNIRILGKSICYVQVATTKIRCNRCRILMHRLPTNGCCNNPHQRTCKPLA